MSAAPNLSLVDRNIAAAEPPWSLEIEQALLGALLRGPSAYYKVCDRLDPEHFFAEIHQRIYLAYAKLIDAGKAATTVTLSPMFKDDPALKDIGGAKYLVDLFRSAVTIVNAEQYAIQVTDLWRRRRLIEIGEVIVNQARETEIDYTTEDMIADAQSRMDLIAEQGPDQGAMLPFGDFVRAAVEDAEYAYKHPGEIRGLSTGVDTLDKRIGGMENQHLLILAGRPSMGKSALAVNIALNVARAGKTVAFFSLEMSSADLVKRCISSEGGIPGNAVREGHMTQENMNRFIDASNAIGHVPLYINDQGTMTMAMIRNAARQIKRKHGLSLVIVDYLQLIHTNNSKAEQRVQEVSAITRALKIMAKELDVPVMALSQLSRALEAREDKRPQLSDLRESGSIEQDADGVLFVYRDDYYISRAEPARRSGESEDKLSSRITEWQQQMLRAKGLAEVIVGKLRHGAIGKCFLRFDASLTKFTDLAPGAHDYEQ